MDNTVLTPKKRNEYTVINDEGTHYVYADSYSQKLGDMLDHSVTIEFMRDGEVAVTLRNVKSIQVNAPL